MIELLLCSLFTIVPDYLYRRYVQKKRIGKEINLFSVWYELRWGITGCLMLTVLLITTVFYFHPTATSATPLFRTIPILPETVGRVSEIYVKLSDEVEQGQPILKLDSSKEEAAVEQASRRVVEAEAQLVVARTELAAADAQIIEAKSALTQAQDELRTKQELYSRNPGNVAFREIERLQVSVEGKKGQLAGAEAGKKSAEARVESLLPAQLATAQAALQQAQVDLSKRVVYAGVSGRVEQFTLRVGDVVNPVMRPAGVLIPEGAGRVQIQAGFGQIEAQVLRRGLTAEALCVSKPLTIIPMVVVSVQEVIAAGQVRAGEQLIDVQQIAKPGTITAFLEPIYEGGLDGIAPGSSCVVNAYTSNHDRIASGEVGTLHGAVLHGIDAVGLVHAIILRLQALVMPIQLLVLGGH
ncbi:biotin/lipoyl-binding protein [Microbacteriaceae bacterium K1510]|nr:biotin/lipoyl-binding protein [Microbacteriaceae bacterium K1510]